VAAGEGCRKGDFLHGLEVGGGDRARTGVEAVCRRGGVAVGGERGRRRQGSDAGRAHGGGSMVVAAPWRNGVMDED
jgi:hypothetical protein